MVRQYYRVLSLHLRHFWCDDDEDDTIDHSEALLLKGNVTLRGPDQGVRKLQLTIPNVCDEHVHPRHRHRHRRRRIKPISEGLDSIPTLTESLRKDTTRKLQ